MNGFRDTTELQVTIGGAFGGGEAGSCETDARAPGGASGRTVVKDGGARAGAVPGTPCPHWRQMQTIPRGAGDPSGAAAAAGSAAASPRSARIASQAGRHASGASPEDATHGVQAAGPHATDVSQPPIARHSVSV